MSVWSSHYDFIYGTDVATDAVLVPTCGEVPAQIRVVDKTSGQAAGYNGVNVETIGPAADVRMSELVEERIALSDLDGGLLTLAGKDWNIVSHQMRPAPTGEAGGEVRLLLEEVRG